MKGPPFYHYLRFQGIRDIHEDSLVLFKLLDPRPDVILIGYGDRSLITDSMTPMEKETRKKNMDCLAKITIAMRVQVNIYFGNDSV
jgi:hypothetical protein